MIIITTRKRSLEQGNVFPVCLSTEGGGVMMSLSVMDSTPPQTAPPYPGQHHLWTAPSPWISLPRQYHPPWKAPPLDSTTPLDSTIPTEQYHPWTAPLHSSDSTPWTARPPDSTTPLDSPLPPNSTTPVKKRAVSILLECFFFLKVSIKVQDSAWNLISWHIVSDLAKIQK